MEKYCQETIGQRFQDENIPKILSNFNMDSFSGKIPIILSLSFIKNVVAFEPSSKFRFQPIMT